MKLRNVGLLALVVTAVVGCDRGKHDGARVTQSGSGSAAADPWNSPAPAKDPLKKPLLWKVEKDGKTSYLLGTIHVGVDPTTRLPDVVWQKLDEKPVFAMETDLSDASKLQITRTDGTTLKDELGPDYWKKLEDAVGAKEAAAMMAMKPMIPATLLSLRGLPKTPPMDGVLHGRASNAHKQMVFLEPLEVQSKMLDKWMNARTLKELLDDLPASEKHLKELLDAYVAGDDAQMVALAAAERERSIAKGRTAGEYDEEMDDMLYKRNASWIAAIEKLHADGGGFIAVGAAHLVGPKSVIELLEKKGFKVTRVTQ